MLAVVTFLVTAAAIPGCAHKCPPLGLNMSSDWDFVSGDRVFLQTESNTSRGGNGLERW